MKSATILETATMGKQDMCQIGKSQEESHYLQGDSFNDIDMSKFWTDAT